MKNLPRIENEICPKCGREKDECSCRRAERYYTAVAAPFYFEGNVRKGLHIFKFRNGKRNYEAYCIEMADTVRRRYGSVKFDMITSVPMTDKSMKKRGYDQCAVLAKALSEMLEIEYAPDILKKIYETPKQHDLSYVFRKGNLAGVYEVTEPDAVNGKNILVCDDVSTSGETLDECAKMLWLCGAENTYGITVALTKSKKKNDERR